MAAIQQFPEPTVGALIINQKGEVFLMRSYKWKGKYCIPGGHVELGEKLMDTVKREVKEETGLSVFDIKPLMFQEFIYDKDFWKKRHFIFFDFSCKTKSTTVRLNSEGQEYVWAPIDQALNLPIEPYAKRTIMKYLETRR